MADTRQGVVLIHGINTNAAWHRTVASVLEPYFRCQPVMYRHYFGLGGLKIFFWPWALVLAAALACVGMHRCASAPLRGAFAASVLAATVVSWTSWFSQRRDWSVIRAAPWGALLAVTLASRSFTIDAGTALAWLLLGVWAAVLRYEFGWAGVSPGFVLVVGLGTLGFGLAWLLSNPLSQLVLWVATIGLVLFLELRESGADSELNGHWRVAVAIGLPVIGFAWIVVERHGGWVGLVAAFALMVAGSWEPRLRLLRAVEAIDRQLDDFRGRFHRRPNVISHSLGTYLAGEYFHTWRYVVWDKVVFVGGVISETYDWAALDLNGADPTVRAVRNEHGGWDYVVAMIPWSGGWGRCRGLGVAGRVGFHPSVAVQVHSVADPRAACPACPPGVPPAPIHNYPFGRFRHSTYFLRRHARELWLPYFWDILPQEYSDFLAFCECGAELLRRDDGTEFSDVEQRFGAARWRFNQAPGTSWTLAEFAQSLIRERILALAAIDPAWRDTWAAALNLLPGLLCQTVALALAEQEKLDSRDEEVLWWLYPPAAIRHAARQALERVLH